jgi:predicted MPP superfamily phosphohydrolase
MKILFLHLTDIHCKDGSDLNNHKLEQMITSLNSLGDIDECILVISGDLAYSGAINEYKIVQKFIGTILSKLGKKI